MQTDTSTIVGAVLEFGTLAKAGRHLNISRKKLTEILKDVFPNKVCKTNWVNYLHALDGNKKCNLCNKVLKLDQFRKNITQGRQFACRPCELSYNKPLKALYRTRKTAQTSTDANKVVIAGIYADCLEGHEVDHIIPLALGGAHHEHNLCYLTKKDNRSKGSKHPSACQDIMQRAFYPNLSAYGGEEVPERLLDESILFS